MGNRIALLNFGLRFAIDSDIVSEIAARAENDLGHISQSGCGKNLSNDVIPGGPGPRKQDRCAVEVLLLNKAFRNGNSLLQILANGSFVVENTFIDLDPAHRKRMTPSR